MSLSARWAVVVGLLGVFGCGAHHDLTSPGDAGPQLDFSGFDAALEQAIANYNASASSSAQIAGASAIVVDARLGLVHSQGYGAYAADRLYLIASSSKLVSAGILVRLADQGELDLDAPISTYLSDWGSSKVGQVTVAQLLSNSSGLPSLAEVGLAFLTPNSPYLASTCQFNSLGTLQDCGKTIYNTAPPRDPDTSFAYGGSQWQLAGALAELVSGESWAQLVTDTYVQPCGVESLGYTNQYIQAGVVYPPFFMGDAANLPATENPSIEGGGYVRLPDYAQLLLMQLRGGMCDSTRVLQADSVARMQENRIGQYGGNTGDADLPGYGFGLWISSDGSVVADPGAYGATPMIDLKRHYAMMIAIELTTQVGMQLALEVKPTLDAIFDGQ